MASGKSVKRSILASYTTVYATILVLALLAGCAELSYEPSLLTFTYPAADKLISNLQENVEQQSRPLRKDKPLLVASFVESGDLEKTSELGRLVAEHMASRLSQKGFSMLELKLRNRLFIKQKAGEFALSRELEKISREHDAQGVLVGTYSAINHFVYVTAKIVNADGHVYASHDFTIPIRILRPEAALDRYEDWR